MTEFIGIQVRMLAPFAPFLSEEIWEKIHKFFNSSLSPSSSDSILFSGWPISNLEDEDLTAEESEQLVQNLLSDIQNIIKVTKLAPTRIHIYVSAKWKRRIYQKILGIIVAENRAKFGEIMKVLSKDPEITGSLKKNVSLVQKIIQDIISISIEVRKRRLKLGESFEESYAVQDAEKLLSSDSYSRFVEILVYREEETQTDWHSESEEKTDDDKKRISLDLGHKKNKPQLKAGHSRPFKPAIYIE
jgi:leucyl-tRNA synthetase